MTFRLCEVSFGHVDTKAWESRPSLFDEVERASGTAANIEKSDAALIAPGEDLMERR